MIYAKNDITKITNYNDLLVQIQKNREKQENNTINQVKIYLKKNKWDKAYNEFVKLYLSIGVTKNVYNLIVLLLISINDIKDINDDILNNIMILINNYFTYFIYSKDVKQLILVLMKFINKHIYNLKFNNISGIINELFNALYIQYKKYKKYIPELTNLNKIRESRYILFATDLFTQYQIIGSTTKIYELYLQQPNNKILIKLNLIILLSFKQIKAATLFIENINDQSIKSELKQILLSV